MNYVIIFETKLISGLESGPYREPRPHAPDTAGQVDAGAELRRDAGAVHIRRLEERRRRLAGSRTQLQRRIIVAGLRGRW